MLSLLTGKIKGTTIAVIVIAITVVVVIASAAGLLYTGIQAGRNKANLLHQAQQLEMLKHEQTKTLEALRMEDSIDQRSPDDDADWMLKNNYFRREE